jgi:hypothetical protein
LEMARIHLPAAALTMLFCDCESALRYLTSICGPEPTGGGSVTPSEPQAQQSDAEAQIRKLRTGLMVTSTI